MPIDPSPHVLVTGASSGIGRATARRLADQGHTVFATARRVDRLDGLATEAREQGVPGTVVPVVLDVRDPASIRRAASVVERHAPDGLDVLVNNAGHSLIGAIETLGGDDIRAQYETNVLGLIETTRAFLPAMRARRHGRIVNVSSVLGRMSFVGTGVYGSTKFALEAISDALRMELAAFGVGVVLVEPGFSGTDIDVSPQVSSQADPSVVADYAELTGRLAAYSAREIAAGAPPETVAEVVVRAATDRRPRARYVVPRRYAGLIGLLDAVPARVADALKLRQLPRPA